MKRGISLLMALVLCLSLFSACGGTAVPSSSAEKTPETLIQEGDKALAEGHLDEARVKYKAAGEPAEEKLTEILLQIASTYTVGDPGEKSVQIAMDHLSNIPESGRLREDVAKAMLETIEQYLGMLAENEYRDPDEYYQPAKDLLDVILCKDLPEYNAVAEKLAIQWAMAHIDNRDPMEAVAVWERFPDHPTISALTEATNLIYQKEFTKALSLLQEKVDNYMDFDWVLFEYIASYTGTNLLQAIDLMAACAVVFPYEPEGMDKEGTWLEADETFKNFQGNIEKRSVTADLTQADIQSLKDLCGKEPAGKILILSRRREYDAAETRLEVSYLMNFLPSAYIPMRLEEVEYVLLVDNDYIDTGETFQVGTKLVKETTQVLVYKVGQNNPVYTSPKRETAILPNTMMMYNGEPPVYYIPSHPHAGGAMTEALKTIMKAIH